MGAKLSILGGSSPFTAALVDEFADSRQGVPAADLLLQGRNVAALALLAEYARRRLSSLGWRVDCTPELDVALDSADIVVHQVRYGGLSGRAADERLAVEFDLPPDETLGPAGLQAALRSANDLRALAKRVERLAPRAWLLNLTNPLSVATALLAERVGAKCLGLCELPWHTVREACTLLGVSPQSAEWSYAGLNHRGFVYRLAAGDRDLIGRLASAEPGITVGGIGSETIRALGAVPLKYFRLMLGQQVLATGRAAALERLRSEILAELAANMGRRPPSLKLRDMPWYALSVAPVIASILCNDGRQHVVNMSDGQVVREFPAKICAAGPIAVEQALPGGAVQAWIDRFVEHERAVLSAVATPNSKHVTQAVRLDPLVPSALSEAMAQRLCENRLRSIVSP